MHNLIVHSVNAIDTPALVIDLDMMERNLRSVMVGVRGGLLKGVVERIINVDARGALT